MMRFGPWVVGKNGPLYELPLIELKREGTYITFSEGAEPSAGELFRIEYPIGIPEGMPSRGGALRKVVAVVKILKIESGRRALVSVLSGSVARGRCAERASGKLT